jgi:outer membrane protein assembly factor BamB
MNGFATPTCATDGERVVAFFGRGGVHCYDSDGNPLWSRDFGDFPGAWGIGASPIILEDKVIQNCDSASPGSSFLVALDKLTGKTVWKTNRPSMPRGGWSTPILIDTESRKELILHGEHGLRGYYPESGKELWFCKGFNGRGTPSPVFGHGLLFVISGKPGDTYAVRPGGKGDVTGTHMAWHTPRKKGRNVASPILVDKYLLCASLQGYVDCYDAISGKLLWNEELDAKFSASPIAVSGLAYFLDEAGKTVVVKPGDKLEVIAQNDIGVREGETFRGSPVPAQGQILVRSDQAIYCIGK